MAWISLAGAAVAPVGGGSRRACGADRAIALLGALATAAVAWPTLMAVPEVPGTEAKRSVDSGQTSIASETLIAGYGGITHTHASDVRFAKTGVTDLTVHGVQWIGRPFKSPIYYGIRAVHWPAMSRLGGMVDFTHAKAISVREQQVRFTGTRNGRAADGTAAVGDTFRHLEFSHGHNMLTLNGLLSLGRITAAIRPYVGLGAGVSLPHTEVQFLDEAKRTYEYQLTGAVGQAVAGIEIRLPRASLFVEYKFSVAPYRVPLSGLDGSKGNAFVDYWGQFQRWWRGEEPEFGRLRTDLFTHHLIFGVGYRQAGSSPLP